jgi:WD40 repeat protein
MTGHLSRIAGAALFAACTLAAMPGNALMMQNTSSAASPDGRMILSWAEESGLISFYDIAKNKVVSTFDAGFKIYGFTYSSSGRYLCINSPSPNARLIVVDTQNHYRKVLALHGKPTSSLRCDGEPGGYPVAGLPAAARSTQLILVFISTLHGPPACMQSYRYYDSIFQYWDPSGRTPKLVKQFVSTQDVCP